jgi:hypothetical protein
VEDECLVALDRDELGELVHRLLHVDVGIAGVVEHPELAVDPHVDARGLDQRLVVGVEDQAPGGDLFLDRSVAEDHRGQSIPPPRAHPRPPAPQE